MRSGLRMLSSTWKLNTFFSFLSLSSSLIPSIFYWLFLLLLFSPFSLFHYSQSLKRVELTNVVPLIVNKYYYFDPETWWHGRRWMFEKLFVLLHERKLVWVWFLMKCLEIFFSPSLHIFTIRTFLLYVYRASYLLWLIVFIFYVAYFMIIAFVLHIIFKCHLGLMISPLNVVDNISLQYFNHAIHCNSLIMRKAKRIPPNFR